MSLHHALGYHHTQALRVLDRALRGRTDGVWLASVAGDDAGSIFVLGRPDGLCAVLWVSAFGVSVDLAPTLDAALARAAMTPGSDLVGYAFVHDEVDRDPVDALPRVLDLFGVHRERAELLNLIHQGASHV